MRSATLFLLALGSISCSVGCSSTVSQSDDGGGAIDAFSANDAFGANDAFSASDTGGDAASTAIDAGTDVGASASDAGHDAASSATDMGTSAGGCPPSAPTAGASCAPTGLACSYGNDPRVQCRVVATCASGSWTVVTPNCGAPLTCPATDPSGMTCSDRGAACVYGTDACECYACIIPCTMPTTWHCAALDPSCPASVPNLGTACSGTTVCNYGGCTGSWAVECSGGVWARHAMPCPG